VRLYNKGNIVALNKRTIKTKNILPMQNFTQDDFEPRQSTILFIKQFARMYNKAKTTGATLSVVHMN